MEETVNDMALREIRKEGDDILRKKCRKVEKFDNRLGELIDDMAETMHKANGVGLAGPQVGMLKQVVVIDVGDGVMELVNPQIVKTEGKVVDTEGCLSVPGVWGTVERPKKVTVTARDRYGKEHTYTGEDLLARAFCHEIDHLSGVLFLDKVIEYVHAEED